MLVGKTLTCKQVRMCRYQSNSTNAALFPIPIYMYLLNNVATTSKQTSWLFWKSLMKGKANMGRKSVSPNIGDQCARADNVLQEIQENRFYTRLTFHQCIISVKCGIYSLTEYNEVSLVTQQKSKEYTRSYIQPNISILTSWEQFDFQRTTKPLQSGLHHWHSTKRTLHRQSQWLNRIFWP